MTSAGPGPSRFRGVFTIPPTPFDDAGQVDERSLRRCVEFCVRAGAHGIVAPVNASESFTLTDDERLLVTDVVVGQTAGRVPVVIGVSGPSQAASELYAREAARSGADAVLAMPPFARRLTPAEIVDFYAAVARAADGLPVWIQNEAAFVGTPMDAAFLASICREIPSVAYVKEETAYAPQVMARLLSLAPDHVKGIMGGMAGRYLLDEFARGACGTMPACEVTDAHVLVWDALERGDLEEARRLHRQLLPLLSYEELYFFAVFKEILVRRGVIASARCRVPGAAVLDHENHRELDRLLADLAPMLTLGLQPDLP